MTTWSQFGFVFLGGGMGSAFRLLTYHLSHRFLPQTLFPLGVLACNLVGCLVAGLLVAYLDSQLDSETWAKSFLVTGLLGGFTTFSAFSIEFHKLMQNGQIIHALIYLATSVLGGISLAAFGYWLIHRQC